MRLWNKFASILVYRKLPPVLNSSWSSKARSFLSVTFYFLLITAAHFMNELVRVTTIPLQGIAVQLSFTSHYSLKSTFYHLGGLESFQLCYSNWAMETAHTVGPCWSCLGGSCGSWLKLVCNIFLWLIFRRISHPCLRGSTLVCCLQSAEIVFEGSLWRVLCSWCKTALLVQKNYRIFYLSTKVLIRYVVSHWTPFLLLLLDIH